MGYPMRYRRIISRNGLGGGYGRPKIEMGRHFGQEPYPGTANLDAVLFDALWQRQTDEDVIGALSKVPSVAQTVDFYRRNPESNGGVRVMAPRRFLDAVSSAAEISAKAMIAGDLRRLEIDQRDDEHLKFYAATAGVTKEQAKAVLDAFFDNGLS